MSLFTQVQKPPRRSPELSQKTSQGQILKEVIYVLISVNIKITVDGRMYFVLSIHLL